MGKKEKGTKQSTVKGGEKEREGKKERGRKTKRTGGSKGKRKGRERDEGQWKGREGRREEGRRSRKERNRSTKPSGVLRGPSHLQFPWPLRATMRSPLRSPAQVEGTQGFLPQPGKTSRDLLQHVSRPDSPTMAREQ